ncbi:MAG TPA: prepilin peptidase [Patescibacteria group bacterium]|nr:prepilin peptidase [Patescibacteria group bacterium]
MILNTLIFFVFGLMIGSFLSVVISRLETDETIIFGRSKCPKCQNKLRSYELVPLLSFVVLKGKCRHCKEKISIFYPFVELVTGLLFALLYIRFADVLIGANLYLFFAFYLLVIMIFVVVFFFDIFHYIIPDKVVIPAIVVSAVLAVINIIFHLDFFIFKPEVLNILLGPVIGGGLFLILVLATKEKGMGWGDVKLGLLIGIILGYPLILVSLFFSFTIGSIVSIILIAAKKKTRKDIVPFGPFLVIGALLALFIGKYIVNWYLGG